MIALAVPLWKLGAVFVGGIVVGLALSAILLALVWKAGK